MLTSRKGYLFFLLPSLTGIAFFFVIPFIGGVMFAMWEDGVDRAFVGLDNFKRVLLDPIFRLGMKNTVSFSLFCTPLVTVLSATLACCLWQYPKMKNVRIGMTLPYILPSTSLVLIWSVLFGNGGHINTILNRLGLQSVAFLSSVSLRIPVVVLFVWRNIGFFTLIIYSALQSIPQEYYENASLEGARFFVRHTSITLPLISPVLIFVTLLSFTASLKNFKEVYMIGGNYPDLSVYTLQHYINNHFANFNYSVLTSASYIFTFCIFLFFALLFALEYHFRKSISG